jgi:hypothetical protein
MLNATINFDKYSIKFEDRLMTECTINGVITLNSKIRNKAYDILHEKYEMKQDFFRGFFRYYGLITRDVK